MNDKEKKNSELRRQKRWELIHSLRVFERGKDEMLGYLVDITQEGLLIGCEKPLPVGREFDFSIEVVSEKMELKAHSLWIKEPKQTKFHKVGFRLINPSPKTRMQIACLIEVLKTQEEEELF